MAGAPSWLKPSSSPSTQPAASSGTAAIAFMCTGNICRSAFAGAYLAASLPKQADCRVFSCGTMALVDHPMDADVAEQARALGISSEAHLAQQATGRLLSRASLIVTFGPEHRAWIARNHPELVSRALAIGQVTRALRRLPSPPALDEVPRTVLNEIPSPEPVDWVADPYRLGPEAARAAVHRIAHQLDTFIERIDWPTRP